MTSDGVYTGIAAIRRVMYDQMRVAEGEFTLGAMLRDRSHDTGVVQWTRESGAWSFLLCC